MFFGWALVARLADEGSTTFTVPVLSLVVVVSKLDRLDLSLRLSREDEEARLAAAQRRLLHLRLVLAGLLGDGTLGPPVCVVFEGWDASGKGGAIKRLVGRLDPRHVRVAQFAAPTPDEKRHHFLARFYARLPAGAAWRCSTDRGTAVCWWSADGFATVEQWERGYEEIVHFERSLALEGTVLVKLWLHISAKEQLRRFESRRDDPLKQWKLTADDWHNREKRRDYEKAVADMLKRTDHPLGPWDLIEAENKRYARVKVIQTVIARIEAGMRRHGMKPPPSMGADFDPQM